MGKNPAFCRCRKNKEEGKHITYKTEDQMRDEFNVPIHKLMFQKIKKTCESGKPGWIILDEDKNEFTSCFIEDFDLIEHKNQKKGAKKEPNREEERRLGSKEKRGEKMRDIQNDLLDVKETCCESCQYNMPGKTWCSKYKRIKPVSVMIGRIKCEKYCMLNNVIMASIVGFAVGDALGVPVEFASREELSKNPVKDMRGKGTHNQKAGTWSDDTSLTIALIKALGDKEFNVDSIARRMMDWLYKGKYTANGKVFDVGNTTREAIWRMHSGVSPIEAGGKDEYSNGNGSLMRIHPLAFYLLDVDDFEEKKNMIYQVSSLTHANIISKVACHFLVELIICLLKTNSIRAAYDTVCREFAEYYTEDKIQSAFANIFSGKILSMPASSVKSSGYVIDTLEAVLWCIFHTTTYKDAVLTAVNLGDDTDTVGAITGGIAGIIYGLNAIPEEWISKLVNKMIVLNAASDLYKKCNKDNIIDNLDFSV